MKTLTHIFAIAGIFISLVLTSSCRKDKDDTPPPPAPVVGTWKGTVIGKGEPTPVRFEILENGTVIVSSQAVQLNGSWKLTSNNFEAGFQVNSIKATAKGTLSDSKNKIDGTWTEDDNGKISEQTLSLKKE
ncbi:hypothetical protein [Niabella aurantiaca]|uniref:hypothetical protein n=1 Tax=Niabella aurantiaca TaxID=379900 RepID=UPI00036BF755|nr:hypothetical protein [Niabella aurantiaca]